MTNRHEVCDSRAEIGIIGPDDEYFWDEIDEAARGRHALMIGDPASSAYVVIGSHDQLREFSARLSGHLDATDPTDPQITEHNLTLWIHTEELWRDLETALGEPRYSLGRWKEWNALGPKHLNQTYDLDKAVAWARKNGIPYTEERHVHNGGTTGTADPDGYLTPHTDTATTQPT